MRANVKATHDESGITGMFAPDLPPEQVLQGLRDACEMTKQRFELYEESILVQLGSPGPYSPPNRRRCSRSVQFFMTTGIPAARALAAAASSTTPSCIQMYLAPTSIASSTTGPTSSERRKMSTMSIS